MTSSLVRDDDTVVYGDSGYLGVEKREEIQNDDHLKHVDFRICLRPSQVKTTGKNFDGFCWVRWMEHRKSSIRCKVEHPFLIVKRQFGYFKTAYRGIAKNMNRFPCCSAVQTWSYASREAERQRFDRYVLGELCPLALKRGQGDEMKDPGGDFRAFLLEIVDEI